MTRRHLGHQESLGATGHMVFAPCSGWSQSVLLLTRAGRLGSAHEVDPVLLMRSFGLGPNCLAKGQWKSVRLSVASQSPEGHSTLWNLMEATTLLPATCPLTHQLESNFPTCHFSVSYSHRWGRQETAPRVPTLLPLQGLTGSQGVRTELPDPGSRKKREIKCL